MQNPDHPARRLLNTEPGGAAQPHGGIRGRQHGGSYSNEATFDTNMVIILAALLCALICALGLNSIVRCALRCSRRMSFEPTERMPGTGVKKKALRQIPVAVYGEGAGIPATECPICLGEFEEGEKVRILPKCNHGFHVLCIDVWLASHSSCPTCRRSLAEAVATDGGGGLHANEDGSAD